MPMRSAATLTPLEPPQANKRDPPAHTRVSPRFWRRPQDGSSVANDAPTVLKGAWNMEMEEVANKRKPKMQTSWHHGEGSPPIKPPKKARKIKSWHAGRKPVDISPPSTRRHTTQRRLSDSPPPLTRNNSVGPVPSEKESQAQSLTEKKTRPQLSLTVTPATKSERAVYVGPVGPRPSPTMTNGEGDAQARVQRAQTLPILKLAVAAPKRSHEAVPVPSSLGGVDPAPASGAGVPTASPPPERAPASASLSAAPALSGASAARRPRPLGLTLAVEAPAASHAAVCVQAQPPPPVRKAPPSLSLKLDNTKRNAVAVRVEQDHSANPVASNDKAWRVSSASLLSEMSLPSGRSYREGPFRIDERGVRFVRDHDSEVYASGKYASGHMTAADVDDIRVDELVATCVIGSGSCSVVKHVLHPPTNRHFAQKIITMSDIEEDSPQRKQVLKELVALYGCSCPYIVDFHAAFFREGCINLVVEFMDSGSLTEIIDVVGRMQEPIIAVIATRLSAALRYLHLERRIIHRDIKPSNVLVNSHGEVKLCDFGVSGTLANTLGVADTMVGTVTYMAPERIANKPYTAVADIWSFGLTILQCSTGSFPYTSEGLHGGHMHFWDLLHLIVNNPAPRMPEVEVLGEEEYSDHLRSFVEVCLQKDPKDRAMIGDLMYHKFIIYGSPPMEMEDKLMQDWLMGTDAMGRLEEKLTGDVLWGQPEQSQRPPAVFFS